MKRAVLIVMDSLGVGALPDADLYGDEGANTFDHINGEMEKTGGFRIPNLTKLGFGNIDSGENGKLAGGAFAFDEPAGSFGRLAEESVGKDTITGHWEIAGLYTDTPFQTFTDEGFPEKFIKEFEKAIGVEVLGNYSESGTVIIDDLGPEHEATGKPIVYTSVDSVLQIAANTDVIPLERLYEICRTARDMLTGDMTIGRVIARPYIIENGKRVRTGDRKDYALSPGRPTILDKIQTAGKSVYCVGKIHDIFNGQGVTQWVHTSDNGQGVDETIRALEKDFQGLIFTNLVDFDSRFGHRRDPIGYGKAIEEFDARLPEIMAAMNQDDVLFLCADHGNDPVHMGWNHTREHIPLVIYGKEIQAGINLGTRSSFADIGATICEGLNAAAPEIGRSFLREIMKKNI